MKKIENNLPQNIKDYNKKLANIYKLFSCYKNFVNEGGFLILTDDEYQNLYDNCSPELIDEDFANVDCVFYDSSDGYSEDNLKEDLISIHFDLLSIDRKDISQIINMVIEHDLPNDFINNTQN